MYPVQGAKVVDFGQAFARIRPPVFKAWASGRNLLGASRERSNFGEPVCLISRERNDMLKSAHRVFGISPEIYEVAGYASESTKRVHPC